MTDVCKDCRFRNLCEELEYNLDCKDVEKCEHYEAFLEGMESSYYME